MDMACISFSMPSPRPTHTASDEWSSKWSLFGCESWTTASNDHDVAMRLRLYEREWHFYEHMAWRVPVRVPVPTWTLPVKVSAPGIEPTPPHGKISNLLYKY